jgi:RimJ/RimL family protein N-acetyltransferase
MESHGNANVDDPETDGAPRIPDGAPRGIGGWPRARDSLLVPRDSTFDLPTTITTPRLSLIPLRAADAEEMVAVLDDQCLHEFTGGRPATLSELRDRYTKLAAGSPQADEVWLNWIVRLRGEMNAIGTVQVTVRVRDDQRTAYVAWVIGTAWQNRGFASEAAGALVAWLRGWGIRDVRAHIHPDHRASEQVALRAGLAPSDEIIDGERVWRSCRD